METRHSRETSYDEIMFSLVTSVVDSVIFAAYHYKLFLALTLFLRFSLQNPLQHASKSRRTILSLKPSQGHFVLVVPVLVDSVVPLVLLRKTRYETRLTTLLGFPIRPTAFRPVQLAQVDLWLYGASSYQTPPAEPSDTSVSHLRWKHRCCLVKQTLYLMTAWLCTHLACYYSVHSERML